jgi:hypothetical protein
MDGFGDAVVCVGGLAVIISVAAEVKATAQAV